MLFSNITAAAKRFCLLAALSACGLSGCAALDEYINPYYDDEVGEQAKHDEGALDTADEDKAADVDDSDTALPEVRNQAISDTAAAPSLLANIGPNPFLSSVPTASAAAQAKYKQALSAMRSEDWLAAEQQLSDMAQTHPFLSGPLLNLGIVQAKQNKDEMAQQSFESAIKVNRSNQEAYNQLGLLYRKQGRFIEAKNTYLRAIDVWPGYGPIRRNLGILFELYIGDLAQALNQYQAYQALQVEPDRKVKGWIIDLRRRLQVKQS